MRKYYLVYFRARIFTEIISEVHVDVLCEVPNAIVIAKGNHTTPGGLSACSVTCSIKKSLKYILLKYLNKFDQNYRKPRMTSSGV